LFVRARSGGNRDRHRMGAICALDR